MATLLTRLVAISIFLPLLFLFAALARTWRILFYSTTSDNLRLVWAGVGIRSLCNASSAMRAAGHNSITVAAKLYDNVEPEHFDRVIGTFRRLPYGFNTLVRMLDGAWVLIQLMFGRDVMHGFFNGGVLAATPLAEYEYRIWKMSGGVLVLLPYGSDSFVYSELPDTPWARALRQSYPRSEVEDARVKGRIKSFTALADCVVGCLVHDQCLPRVDERVLLWYPYDANWRPSTSGPSRSLKLAHSSNHRALKGTDALDATVMKLQARGRNISLEILEGLQHQQVLDAYRKADVVVDQLLFGYAMSALEGMAMGKAVITGIDDEPIYQPYRKAGMLSDCPLIFASPETIEEELEGLVSDTERVAQLGRQCRQFAEKHHSPERCAKLFAGIYEKYG